MFDEVLQAISNLHSQGKYGVSLHELAAAGLIRKSC